MFVCLFGCFSLALSLSAIGCRRGNGNDNNGINIIVIVLDDATLAQIATK